jgi:hypothetical protein
VATAARKKLLRQLEGRIRRGIALTDTRWQLKDTGMTADELWAFELPIRRRIREERAGRKSA